MHCLQAEEHFSAHYEDTLDYRVLRDFEAHLDTCEACQSEYTRFQESVKAIQQLPQIEPSPDFMPRLQQRLAEERREIGVLRKLLQPSWERLQDMFRPSQMGIQWHRRIDSRRRWWLSLSGQLLIQSGFPAPCSGDLPT